MKISIIMCVKNSMPYIMTSIKSFTEQTYKNKELIIVYSDSNDNTKYYLDSLNDKNIKIYNFNGSIYKSLNYGIQKSKGDIVGILHSDDVFHISEFFKKKQNEIIYGNILYSEKNNLLKINRIWESIKLNKEYQLPPHTSVFIKKEILKKIKYKTKFLIAGDTEFLLNLKRKYNFAYLNKFVVIMRGGGLSTRPSLFFHKLKEDIKIFQSYNMSIFQYFFKLLEKINQILKIKKIEVREYHKVIEKETKVNFINVKRLFDNNGKIISALNLAFLTYNFKYNLRTHKHQFWPDGIFANILTNKQKIAGRVFLMRIIGMINKNSKINNKIYILGNLENKSKKWLSKKIKKKFIHKTLPFGKVELIVNNIKKFDIKKKSIIFLTLPTPKQELIANFIIKRNPDVKIICIGGSINIASGVEEESPKILSLLYLEWLWRLKFDTKRRVYRLIESAFLLLKLLYLRKINIF